MTETDVPRVRLTPGRLRAMADRTRTLGMFDDLARHATRHATRAAELRLLRERTWLLTDPALARQALVEPAHIISRSARYQRISALLGQSLLTTDGAEHHRRRRVIQPTFRPRHIRDFTPSIALAVEQTAQTWRPGDVVRMEQEMAALTLAAIGHAVLGVDGRQVATRVSGAVDRLQRAIALTLVPGAEHLLQSPLPAMRRLREAMDDLRAVADDAAAGDAPFVVALRAVAEEGETLTQQDVRDELLTLLLAGHETTAGTLTWAWWFLDRHPRVADRLCEEARDVLSDRTPAYDDVAALPFTTAVVAETLRLRPAAWIVEREVVAPVDLDGLRPPVGTVLAVSPWVLHRDPASWSDASTFAPDRWLDANGAFDDAAPGQPRGAWLPFGGGSHVCVGASFAWTEAVLALAGLARQWRPTGSDPAMRLRAGATIRPARPMHMRLELAP
jgi:cytochrome P450